MCMWDNMVECTKGIMLWVRNVFNIWVGLWSSESVCSVCVMLCLGSVHELLKGGFGVCRAMYVYVPGREAGLVWNLLVTMLMAIYFSGDYEGGCWYTGVVEFTWQRSWACAESYVDCVWIYLWKLILEIYTGELKYSWDCIWHNIFGRLNKDWVTVIWWINWNVVEILEDT